MTIIAFILLAVFVTSVANGKIKDYSGRRLVPLSPRKAFLPAFIIEKGRFGNATYYFTSFKWAEVRFDVIIGGSGYLPGFMAKNTFKIRQFTLQLQLFKFERVFDMFEPKNLKDASTHETFNESIKLCKVSCETCWPSSPAVCRKWVVKALERSKSDPWPCEKCGIYVGMLLPPRHAIMRKLMNWTHNFDFIMWLPRPICKVFIQHLCFDCVGSTPIEEDFEDEEL